MTAGLTGRKIEISKVVQRATKHSIFQIVFVMCVNSNEISSPAGGQKLIIFHRGTKMRHFFLLFSILSLLATNSEAAIYYVGKSGRDANSCATAQSSTAGNRKLTIKAGINCMNGGDELVIGNGTYDEWITP